MEDKLKIVFEDNHVIVLIKPQGVLSQGDKTGDENLVDMLKAYRKEKENKQGEAFIGLVHRLDRVTGGLMVFAKTSKAASRLSESIKNNEVEKTYLAVIENAMKEKQATLTHYLLKDEENNIAKVLAFNQFGAKEAKLSYKVLEQVQKVSKILQLLSVQLETGRGHQIRAQLSFCGCPIVGDAKYGSTQKARNIALWAYRLHFIHPVTKEEMSFISYPETDKLPWSNFDGKKVWDKIFVR